MLACLDRSALNDSCLTYARFLADAFGAKLTLLHVLPSSLATHEERPDALDWEIAKREADQYLSRARASVGVAPGGTVTRLTQGIPADQIVGAAREVGADLTVLSHHNEGIGASQMGSTARQVLSSAAGPLLITHATREPRVPPHRILVPLDGSLRSESVLPFVAELARHSGPEVLLVHVVTEPTATAVMSRPDDMELASSLASRLEVNAKAYLARVCARLLPRVSAVRTLVVRRPEEREALLEVATQESADLLALTAHGSTCNGDRPAGSVASYVVSYARLPVFLLQDIPRDRTALAQSRAAEVARSVRPPEVD